ALSLPDALPIFDEALLLAGGVVLGVFLQVAVLARLGDRGDDFRPLDRLEPFQLRAQALGALVGDRSLHLIGPVSTRKSGAPPGGPACVPRYVDDCARRGGNRKRSPVQESPACSSCSDQTGPASRKSSDCTSARAPATVVE